MRSSTFPCEALLLLLTSQGRGRGPAISNHRDEHRADVRHLDGECTQSGDRQSQRHRDNRDYRDQRTNDPGDLEEGLGVGEGATPPLLGDGCLK